MRRIVIVGCLLLLLAGCATNASRKQQRKATLDNYAAALRWEGFGAAWSFVDPAVRAAHPLTPQQKALYGTVRVAEYEAGNPVSTGADTISQTARIRLVDRNSQKVYGVIDHQTWHWDATNKRWWLESGLPDITPP